MSLPYSYFLSYCKLKAYDVLSAGHFRKYLSSSRDSGETWAVTLYNQHNIVQQKIKELSLLVADMSNPLVKPMQVICKDVMSCAQPPVKLQAGVNKCSITKRYSEHCLDLTKIGKDISRQILVNNRFWYFFVFLWYCSKLEYILRSCAKQWMAVHNVKPSSNPAQYNSLCEEFLLHNVADIGVMHELFLKAYDYVTKSLRQHNDKYSVQMVLQPPPDYMQTT
jgi:hypothetical protein